MEKGDMLSEEERQALALIVLLIEAFESSMEDDDEQDDEEDSEPPAPHVVLARLMTSHGVELADVTPIFGNPQAAREAIEGRRPITRGQAKELSKYFKVPVKLFREDREQ